MEERRKYAGRRKYLPALFVVLGTLLFVNLFSAANYETYSLLFRLDVSFGRIGQTRLTLPPVGTISAQTHAAPIQLSVTLQNIDLAVLRSIVFSSPEGLQKLIEGLQNRFSRLIIYHVTRLVLIGALGACIGLWVTGVRKVKHFLWSALAGGLIVLFFIGVTYSTYDVNAFDNPEYQGIIEAAPWMLNAVQESLQRVEALGDQIQTLARNLYSAFQQLEDIGQVGVEDVELLVLHVSDIHNNPVAYDFAWQVIHSFPVDFIVDTGDLTDWGTQLEAEIVQRIEEIDIPYIFTSGNHDSPNVLYRLQQTENVIVVGPGEYEINGLRIVGIGDVSAGSTSPKTAPVTELTEIARQINESWRDVQERPDIFMVHNHRIARQIEPGLFPIVLYGHNHILEMEQIDGTVYINAGTTGAAGIRGFQGNEPLPYSLSLLHFGRNDQGTLSLIAVDGIHVAGLGSSFSLQRTFIDHGRNQDGDVEILDDSLW